MGKYKDEDKIIKGLHDRLFITHFDGEDWFEQIMNQVVDEIKNTPAADVVEVVRCKDCKYNDLAGKESANALCSRFYGSWQADDYCSYGERKDG